MRESAATEANEVCIVDDDASVLKSMHYLLASEGFKVRPFNKAEDFLAHAGAHHVPVVVTDIWMDQVTGLELLARLCAISPRTKVIVITDEGRRLAEQVEEVASQVRREVLAQLNDHDIALATGVLQEVCRALTAVSGPETKAA